MKSLLIFLNELSLSSGDEVSPRDLLRAALSTLAALKEIKRIRKDVVVAGMTTISGIFFCETYSLAEVLRDEAHREEWGFIQNLDQSSPLGVYHGSIRPGELQEVIFQGSVANGMLWAAQNQSAVISFAVAPSWNASHLTAQFRQMNEDGDVFREIQIANISNVEHVNTHRRLIRDYGMVLSNSSIVYEGDGFVIRMYFNDHPRPHFHVMMRRDTSESLARIDIETLDLLSGQLPPTLRRRVKGWALERKAELTENWRRCREQLYPIKLED